MGLVQWVNNTIYHIELLLAIQWMSVDKTKCASKIVVKPKPKKLLWPVRKNTDIAVNHSKLESKTFHQCEAVKTHL